MKDYERMLDLTVSLMEDARTESPWQLITGEVKDSLNGTLCMLYDDIRLEARAGRTEAWSPAQFGELPLDALLQGYMDTHPLARHYATRPDRTPLSINDVSSQQAWQRTPTYEIVSSVLGVTHQLALPMNSPQGAIRSFLVSRPDEDFSDRDKTFARRMQPVLNGLDTHIRHMHQWRASVPHSESENALFGEPCERAAQEHLTPRQLTVLVLLAEGRTAVSIARRLNISPHTVNTHLESIYRKLGTRDRLSTVLRAQTLHLLPPPPGGPHGRPRRR